MHSDSNWNKSSDDSVYLVCRWGPNFSDNGWLPGKWNIQSFREFNVQKSMSFLRFQTQFTPWLFRSRYSIDRLIATPKTFVKRTERYTPVEISFKSLFFGHQSLISCYSYWWKIHEILKNHKSIKNPKSNASTLQGTDSRYSQYKQPLKSPYKRTSLPGLPFCLFIIVLYQRGPSATKLP